MRSNGDRPPGPVKIGAKALFAAGILAATAALSPDSAHAAQRNINFGINIYIPNACSIVLQGAGGTLGVNAAANQLSSKLAGGAPAVARVTSNSNYWLQADVVPYFTMSPTGGDTGVTFSATFAGQAINARGLTFAERPGPNRIRLRTGNSIQDITVHYNATRASGVYPAGNYRGVVVLRCE